MTSDPRGKIQAARTKTLLAAARSCIVTPGFGFTDAPTVNTAAVDEDIALTVDIFGPVAGAAPGDDRLPDAWGRDIVFMPRGHPAIGTALQDRPFFFSAGPDGRYHTLEDNLYSYEIAPGAVSRDEDGR